MRFRPVRWLLVLAGAPLILIAVMFFSQAALIYYPRSYAAPEYQQALEQVQRVEYSLNGKAQTSFLAGETGRPEKVWLLFGGNGSLALDWLPMLPRERAPGVAWLLVDYPAYGFNEGKPSPRRIQKSIEALLPVAARQLGLSEEELVQRAAVMGHSIGCAVALKTAEEHRVKEVVLISPFTSMLDMARQTIGPVICQLLTHRFDNLRALRSWLDQNGKDRPVLRIFHGDSDDLIPIRMSRELRDLAPDRITLTGVPDAGHNDVVWAVRDVLAEILAARD